MKNLYLRFTLMGIALIAIGSFFLISPSWSISCREVGMVIIFLLAALIALQVANLYLNLRQRGRNTEVRN